MHTHTMVENPDRVKKHSTHKGDVTTKYATLGSVILEEKTDKMNQCGYRPQILKLLNENKNKQMTAAKKKKKNRAELVTQSNFICIPQNQSQRAFKNCTDMTHSSWLTLDPVEEKLNKH